MLQAAAAMRLQLQAPNEQLTSEAQAAPSVLEGQTIQEAARAPHVELQAPVLQAEPQASTEPVQTQAYVALPPLQSAEFSAAHRNISAVQPGMPRQSFIARTTQQGIV